MGKCYCDYCDVFLTNDSVTVRKQHNDGNRHKHNVCEYYRQYVGHQLQQQIDDIVAQFELDVARGLVRPTYGLPPPPKKPAPASDPAPKPRADTAPDDRVPASTPPPQDARPATPEPRAQTHAKPHTPRSAASTPS